jgi:WD40 repeat protein
MRVWDARTGRLLRQLDIGDLQVRGFRLSPDGKQVAALGFRFNEAEQQKYDIIQFSDVLTGKRQSSISWVGAKTDTKVLCYTPDGASIFTGSRDGTLRFWDVFTGEELLQRKLPKSDIQDMAVSPDGHQLVVITRRSVFQWEWLAGKEPQELNTGIDRPLSADFSPDGAWLASVRAASQVLSQRQVGSCVRQTGGVGLGRADGEPGEKVQPWYKC